MTFALPKRPEPYRHLIKRSIKLYRLAFSHVFVLALLLSFIAFIPRLLSHVVGQNIFTNGSAYNINHLWLFVINISCLIIFTAMLWRVRCVITGAHETIEDDMKIALIKTPYIFVAGFLQLIVLGVVTILCSLLVTHLVGTQPNDLLEINPIEKIAIIFIFFVQLMIVMYIFFSFYFYLPIILVENEGIFSSLIKSFKLVQGNWWRTFLFQITPWLTYLLVLIVIRWLTGINIYIYFLWEEPTLLITILQIFLFATFIPWVAATMLLQLNDLELRKKKI